MKGFKGVTVKDGKIVFPIIKPNKKNIALYLNKLNKTENKCFKMVDNSCSCDYCDIKRECSLMNDALKLMNVRFFGENWEEGK